MYMYMRVHTTEVYCLIIIDTVIIHKDTRASADDDDGGVGMGANAAEITTMRTKTAGGLKDQARTRVLAGS
jgi:hypothetical protein